MSKRIHVHLLPSLTSPDQLSGNTVVVIDVLRATTTIVHALACGATRVIPCLEVDEARDRANQFRNNVVLGGERGGLRIDGFDFGNSPEEYVPAAVRGKTVVFTTTNGTKAMMVCRSAARVLLGAFVNYSAVCGRVAKSKSLDLLCAGTCNQITREDVLLAGAIVDDLTRVRQVTLQLNDQAQLAVDAWCNVGRDFTGGKPITEALRTSYGGRNMIEIGLQRDIEIAATIDKFDIVPELDTREWVIRVP